MKKQIMDKEIVIIGGGFTEISLAEIIFIIKLHVNLADCITRKI
jgi:NADH dehydrogenase FAD-containing subunit